MKLHCFWLIRGVTLMELLIVVAIIGVLAAMGYSGYSKLKMESRRTDAQSALIATEAMVERYLAENNKDNLDSSDLALAQFADYGVASSTPVFSKEGYYRITIDPDTTGYTIAATATIGNSLTSCADSANAARGQCPDLNCRVLVIFNNEHSSINSSGATADADTTTCW